MVRRPRFCRAPTWIACVHGHLQHWPALQDLFCPDHSHSCWAASISTFCHFSAPFRFSTDEKLLLVVWVGALDLQGTRRLQTTSPNHQLAIESLQSCKKFCDTWVEVNWWSCNTCRAYFSRQMILVSSSRLAPGAWATSGRLARQGLSNATLLLHVLIVKQMQADRVRLWTCQCASQWKSNSTLLSCFVVNFELEVKIQCAFPAAHSDVEKTYIWKMLAYRKCNDRNLFCLHSVLRSLHAWQKLVAFELLHPGAAYSSLL